MLTEITPATAYRILELAFFAGVVWFTLKQLRKDLNGIGRKVRDQAEIADRARREHEELADRRFLAAALIILCMAPDSDRKLFANWLQRANRGKHGPE